MWIVIRWCFGFWTFGRLVFEVTDLIVGLKAIESRPRFWDGIRGWQIGSVKGECHVGVGLTV